MGFSAPVEHDDKWEASVRAVEGDTQMVRADGVVVACVIRVLAIVED